MVALGLDIGSSSVKVAVTDLSGGKKPFVVRYPQQEMKISSPFAGWAEQHPDDWWTYVIHGIRLALSESGTGATDIVSIGISYQMHGLVIVDKDGHVHQLHYQGRLIDEPQPENTPLFPDEDENNDHLKY